MNRIAWLFALLAAPALLATPEAARKVDKKAQDALTDAEKLVYRPLDHGLKDISFTFDVLTRKGKLTCLWLYRAAAGDSPARERWAVKNIEDRSTRRKYAAGLREYHDIAVYPVLMKPFSEGTDAMDVTFEDSPRGPMTVMAVPEPKGGRKAEDKPLLGLSRLTFLWNSAGLPVEVTKTVWEEDPDEGAYKEESTATYEWKQYGKNWAISLVNSDFTGFRILARYEYKEVKGMLLPSEITRINPMEGEDRLPLNDLKVNEGISDEEFSKW